jgi:hypothetical protein
VVYPLTSVLIDALPEESRRKLLKQVARVNIPLRASLYEPGNPPRFAHFLTSGIASVVTVMGDGSTAEVGTLGREGVPQALHLLRELHIPTRSFMQTVTEVASGLQDRGLIEYIRGSIKVVDRIGLENASCECYPVTRNLLVDVYKFAHQTVFEDAAR